MLFYAWLLFGAASVPVLDGIGIFPKPWESDGLLEADIDAIGTAWLDEGFAFGREFFSFLPGSNVQWPPHRPHP